MRQAFTMVELLVTVAIIGLLAALLLPTLGRTEESGRSALCLSNLHQIGVALQLYVGENHNRMPTIEDVGLGTNFTTNATAINVVLANQLGSIKILRCPSDLQRLFANTGSSYSWNNLVNGQDADHLQIMTTPVAGVRAPLVFDKAGFHAALGKKHAQNTLYADGHIRNLLTLDLSP